MKTKIVSLVRLFGLLFVMTGLVLPGMDIFDAATATPATARIVKLGQTCERRTCEAGTCRWRRYKCAQEAALIAEGMKVRRKKHAKLEFGNGAEPLTAWASFSKLELPRTTAVGDTLPILYRGPAPYYVTLPPSFLLLGIGINSLMLGLVLLYATGQVAKAGQPGQLSGSSQGQKLSPLETGTRENTSRTSVAKRPSLVPNPFAAGPDRAPCYISNPRQNVVQRNKSWF